MSSKSWLLGGDRNCKKYALFLRTCLPRSQLSFMWPTLQTQLFNFMLELSVLLLSTSLEPLSRSFLLA